MVDSRLTSLLVSRTHRERRIRVHVDHFEGLEERLEARRGEAQRLGLRELMRNKMRSKEQREIRHHEKQGATCDKTSAQQRDTGDAIHKTQHDT